MAKPDQEAHRMSRALVPLHSRPSSEQWQTAIMRHHPQPPDTQAGLKHLEPSTHDLVRQAIASPTVPATDRGEPPKALDRRKQEAFIKKYVVSMTPAKREPQTKDLLPIAGTEHGTEVARSLIEKALALRRAESLMRQTDEGTKLIAQSPEEAQARELKMSRAEGIVLKAIRSKANSDGKYAKVAYDGLAAMTGYSRRHVLRAVKSLIFERGLLRVDKRRLRPGHNAINVYHLVNRDVTATEKGIDMKMRRVGQTDTTRVTAPVTQLARPRTILALRHVPLSSTFVTEKPGSTYLTAGSKPRYLTQGLTLPEKVAA